MTDQTIQQLKRSIVTGEFEPGQRLPTERELAVRLGVSRNTLREAIRALTLGGILEARQGSGTYVSSLSPGRLLDSFSLLIEASGDATVLDLLAVRRVLEAEAAALAAARITDAQLAELSGCLADIRFHETVAAVAGNPVLEALIQSLGGRALRERVRRSHPGGDAGGHDAIYAAIRDRDPARAAAAMATHIGTVESFLRTARAD